MSLQLSQATHIRVRACTAGEKLVVTHIGPMDGGCRWLKVVSKKLGLKLRNALVERRPAIAAIDH